MQNTNKAVLSVDTKARTFIEELARGEWDHPRTPFDETMSRVMPSAELHAVWQKLEATAGPFRSVEEAHSQIQGDFQIVLVTCRFEHDLLVAKIVYDARDRIAGLFFLPAWTAPTYANSDAWDEQDLKVGVNPALPGLLTLPKANGPFPAVVLVHGSGPMDEDESVGGVKMFKDLAWGLASRGVAVLRYEKRSRYAPSGIVTQKEEVLDGAHDAIELLRHTRKIDINELFVIGHSQGGYLAPRIARANPNLAGIVILAGSTRPLEESLIDQLTYFASLEPKNTKIAEALNAAEQFKQTVEDPNLRAEQDVAWPTGGRAKGAYFLDIRDYAPASAAQALSCRIFVLQGERDYQVTMKDFDGWKRALTGNRAAVLKTYPRLNHLFVGGSGMSTPAEYQQPGHVDEGVVSDISEWILRGRN